MAIHSKIQFKRSNGDFSTSDLNLAHGEPFYDYNNSRMYIGDGTNLIPGTEAQVGSTGFLIPVGYNIPGGLLITSINGAPTGTKINSEHLNIEVDSTGIIQKINSSPENSIDETRVGLTSDHILSIIGSAPVPSTDLADVAKVTMRVPYQVTSDSVTREVRFGTENKIDGVDTSPKFSDIFEPDSRYSSPGIIVPVVKNATTAANVTTYIDSKDIKEIFVWNTDTGHITGQVKSSSVADSLSSTGTIGPNNLNQIFETNTSGTITAKVKIATTSDSATTATKLSTSKGSSTVPVYVSNSGVITTCSTYAGGTKVTLNGANKGGSTATIYSPTSIGTSGYLLAAGESGYPEWVGGLQTLDASGNTIKFSIGGKTYEKTITEPGQVEEAQKVNEYIKNIAITDIFTTGTSGTITSTVKTADLANKTKNKIDVSTKIGSATQPVYVNDSGVITVGNAYAGGTRITLNGTTKGGTTASFYAPTYTGQFGQMLISNGSGNPSWKSYGIDLSDLNFGNSSVYGDTFTGPKYNSTYTYASLKGDTWFDAFNSKLANSNDGIYQVSGYIERDYMWDYKEYYYGTLSKKTTTNPDYSDYPTIEYFLDVWMVEYSFQTRHRVYVSKGKSEYGENQNYLHTENHLLDTSITSSKNPDDHNETKMYIGVSSSDTGVKHPQKLLIKWERAHA